MDRLLNVMTGFSVLLIGLVLVSVRRAHIRVEYSVSWLAAGLALLVLSRWRALLDRIGSALGLDGAPAGVAGGDGRAVPAGTVSIIDDDFEFEGFQYRARTAAGDPRVPP